MIIGCEAARVAVAEPVFRMPGVRNAVESSRKAQSKTYLQTGHPPKVNELVNELDPHIGSIIGHIMRKAGKQCRDYAEVRHSDEQEISYGNRPSAFLGRSDESLRQKPDKENKIIQDSVNPHDRSSRVRRIQEEAYRRAEARGFAPGAELDDWLAAERSVDEDLGSPPKA